MTGTCWIAPDRIFFGARLLGGLALRIADGRVAEVGPAPPGAQRLGGTVAPGFVDLQVNGGGGVLFNNDPTPGGIAQIIAAHRRLGTAALLVTVITDASDVLDRAVGAVLAAREQRGLLGIHIEGPHLDPRRRGTHAAGFVRPMEATTIAHVRRLRAAGVPVMITLAPEAVRPGQIATLAALGAVVSLGHTDAEADTVRAAMAEGAMAFTHLFNAMSPMLNRSPGVTGAAINSGAHAGIICDGIHVADEMVALAIRARPVPDRMFLVSDAMATVGGPDRFDLYGQEIRLVEGRLVNAEGSLAGAHVTMADSVARLVGSVGVAPEEALHMAITVPAALMGAPDLGAVVGRPLDDLVCLDGAMRLTGRLAEIAAVAGEGRIGSA